MVETSVCIFRANGMGLGASKQNFAMILAHWQFLSRLDCFLAQPQGQARSMIQTIQRDGGDPQTCMFLVHA